ncbi:hypothetical protein LLG50_07700 [Lactococcus lactis subsp. lactis]|nr:hypothetical protein LLG50_07700 [Lactococcus lactis subsp. lactis]
MISFSPWSKTVMADDSGKVTVTGILEMGKTATLTQSTGFGRTAIFIRVGNLVTVYSESRHTTAPPNGWNREVATLPVGWRPIGNSCLWQHDLSILLSSRGSKFTQVDKLTYMRQVVLLHPTTCSLLRVFI